MPREMRRADTKPRPFRIAITFDRKTFDYYSHMSKDRNEAFSHTIASILTEVMHDDIACEKMNADGTNAAH